MARSKTVMAFEFRYWRGLCLAVTTSAEPGRPSVPLGSADRKDLREANHVLAIYAPGGQSRRESVGYPAVGRVAKEPGRGHVSLACCEDLPIAAPASAKGSSGRYLAASQYHPPFVLSHQHAADVVGNYVPIDAVQSRCSSSFLVVRATLVV